MNRRRFLASATTAFAAAVGATAASRWFRSRRGASDASMRDTLPETGRTSQADAAGRKAHSGRSAVPGVKGDAAALRFAQGLPLRWADPKTTTGVVAQALEAAERHILAHCTDLGFGNGAIHGVRALGRSVPLGPGDPFRSVLERYTQESFIEGHVFLEVASHHEGHRHAMLKTLVERQCDLDLEFAHDGRAYRFRDYVNSALSLHTYDLDTLPLDEQSWAIMAFARVLPPSSARWTNVYGHTLDLETMIDDTDDQLRRDTRLIRGVDLRADELPRDCDVLGRACGGLHMHYALAVALSCGYDTPERRKAFASHMKTLVRRFTYDLRVIDQVEVLNRERVPEENAQIRAFSGRLKFLGHAMEVVGISRQFELYDFKDSEWTQVEEARERLCEILVASAERNFRRYRSDRFLFESLVGDVCHAYNGLLMSLV